jgi:DNA-binding response OmpR family regulator
MVTIDRAGGLVENSPRMDNKPASPAARVLIVDDNQEAADTLGVILRGHGYEVRTCYDGRTALEQASDFQPRAVILDIRMPQLTGYEAARAFKRESRGKPPVLIALTGATGEAAEIRARMAGFDHYIAKPADPARILELLKTLA